PGGNDRGGLPLSAIVVRLDGGQHGPVPFDLVPALDAPLLADPLPTLRGLGAGLATDMGPGRAIGDLAGRLRLLRRSLRHWLLGVLSRCAGWPRSRCPSWSRSSLW